MEIYVPSKGIGRCKVQLMSASKGIFTRARKAMFLLKEWDVVKMQCRLNLIESNWYCSVVYVVPLL